MIKMGIEDFFQKRLAQIVCNDIVERYKLTINPTPVIPQEHISAPWPLVSV